MIEMKPATAEHIHAWYDGPPVYSMKGYVIFEGEEMIALCGVFFCRGRKYIFSEVKEQMFKYKKAIIRAARQIMSDMEGQTVYAMATEGLESAPRFIKHYGFECLDPVAKIYRRL